MGTPNATPTSNVLNNNKLELKSFDILNEYRFKIAPLSKIVNTTMQTQKNVNELKAITWVNYFFKNKLIWKPTINRHILINQHWSLVLFYFFLVCSSKYTWEVKIDFVTIQAYTLLWKVQILYWLKHLIDTWIIEVIKFYVSDKELENVKNIPTNRKLFEKYSFRIKFKFIN